MVQLSLRSSTTSHYSLTFAPEMESPDYHRTKGTRFPLSFQFYRTVKKDPHPPFSGCQLLTGSYFGAGGGGRIINSIDNNPHIFHVHKGTSAPLTPLWPCQVKQNKI